MDDKITYVGVANQRTATNRDGHVVTVSRNALRAGVNLVATDLLSVLPVFASIIEEIMTEGGRVICFHSNSRLHGISNKFDVLNIGGDIIGATIRESDAPHIAAYALAHPKRHIFINLSKLDAGSPARFIAEFLKAYRRNVTRSEKLGLVANYGIHQSITRNRDGIGDTRATHDVMRFQHLASTYNIGILNAANSLSELPREFVTNSPNLGVGRVVMPKHYNELGSHIPEDDMVRIRVCKRDGGYGIMKVANGPLTYYPGTDMPNDLGLEMPYVLMPAALKSDIGKDPADPDRPKKNKHVEDLAEFIEEARKEELKEAEAARGERIAEKALRDMKDKAKRAGTIAKAQQEQGLAVAARPVRSRRKPRPVTSDNVVRLAFGHSESGAQDDTGIIMTMLEAADVPHADVLSSHGPKTVMAQDDLFNAAPHPRFGPQKIALRIIGDALVQEAILAGHLIAERERDNPISAAAVAAAYVRALHEDEHLARRFHDEEIGQDAGETLTRLRQVGAQATGARRDEAQFQVVRSAWARFRSKYGALSSAA